MGVVRVAKMGVSVGPPKYKEDCKRIFFNRLLRVSLHNNQQQNDALAPPPSPPPSCPTQPRNPSQPLGLLSNGTGGGLATPGLLASGRGGGGFWNAPTPAGLPVLSLISIGPP